MCVHVSEREKERGGQRRRREEKQKSKCVCIMMTSLPSPWRCPACSSASVCARSCKTAHGARREPLITLGLEPAREREPRDGTVISRNKKLSGRWERERRAP